MVYNCHIHFEQVNKRSSNLVTYYGGTYEKVLQKT